MEAEDTIERKRLEEMSVTHEAVMLKVKEDFRMDQ